ERGNFIYTVAWGVNADSPNRDAAVRVLEALTSPEAQQFILEEGLAIPSREALADNPYFQEESREAQGNLTVFQGASDGNVLGFQFVTVSTDYMGPLNNAATAVMTGQATAEEAVSHAQQEPDALLQRAGESQPRTDLGRGRRHAAPSPHLEAADRRPNLGADALGPLGREACASGVKRRSRRSCSWRPSSSPSASSSCSRR